MPEDNIAPRLAGENVQHIDMLYMSYAVCLYVFDIIYNSLKYVNSKSREYFHFLYYHLDNSNIYKASYLAIPSSI
jgi:hypothetical protein